MAHQAGVLSVQSVPWPGELLSLGADGVVKIWDHTATCVGHILTTAEQSSASASAWKFIRRDHTVGTQNDLFERIAKEVIAKHQRRLKKELSRQRKAGHQPQNEQPVSENSLATPSSLLELDSTVKLPFGPQISGFPDASIAMTNAANALVTQVPFSVTSVTSGIHQGIFGPEEAQHLRSIAKKSKALLLDVSDKRKRMAALAPLFSSPEEMGRARAKAKAKARAMMNNSPQILDFPSRALTNYPLELERRAAANAKASASALRAFDPEPSPFLREKLQDAASSIGKSVKSTPKKRLRRPIATPEIDIKMNASVVILARNVSLPKLAQSPGQEPGESSHTLSSSASAPVLNATEPASGPEKKIRSSNIERKLKLCQKIVANVCLMSSKPKVSKEHSEKEKPDSPSANTRHQALALAIAQGKNPFGPNYTVKQVEQLAVRLARLDEDGSGDLDQQEWKQLVEFCGLESNATSIDNLFHSLDRDSDGTVSIRELLPSLVSWQNFGSHFFFILFWLESDFQGNCSCFFLSVVPPSFH
ncbi:hypothetical protein AM588_10008358 [Phytophthora nicotianae]|nr:hypothetical protein AM588_10008358 [Phytophthora nicotianae]